MQENYVKKYLSYAYMLSAYILIALKNLLFRKRKTVHYLFARKTLKEMYDKYGFINLIRVMIRAPKNLNFSKSGITLFKNVFLPKNKKTALSTSLEVTNNCPYKCKGCYIKNKTSKYFMPEKLLKKVIESLQYSEFIIIQGGEPCQAGYMDILYNAIKDNPNQAFIICTSGVYIGKNGLGKFKNLNNILWAISINGEEEINDTIRFKGSYKYAIKAMENIRKAQQYFVAVATVSKLNIKSATSEKFVMQLAKVGVKEIKYLILRDPESGIQLTRDEVNYWDNYTKKYNKYLFTTFSIDEIEGYSVIDPYGNMRIDRTGHDNELK